MVQFSPRWVLTQAPAEGPSSVPHCQVTTLSTAPCRIDLATGLSRQGFSECGLCSHQEEWFGIGKFQVSDVAWTSACGGGRRGTVAPCRHQNLQAEALATNTHRNATFSAPRDP